ncbi:hypothetical protein M3Y97_01075000 [Aphelenchoides bicaudatus]|nr:hypothetical protein M3Y97_01075000 [Aphelenchoides bicaudatus]
MKFVLLLIALLVLIDLSAGEKKIRCSKQKKCASGSLCGGEGFCYKKDERVPGPCISNVCADGYFCDSPGYCRQGTETILGQCTSGHCPSGYKCKDTQCRKVVWA